jgi:hypothetical protein
MVIEGMECLKDATVSSSNGAFELGEKFSTISVSFYKSYFD